MFTEKMMHFMNAKPRVFSEKDNQKPLVGDNVEITILDEAERRGI